MIMKSRKEREEHINWSGFSFVIFAFFGGNSPSI